MKSYNCTVHWLKCKRTDCSGERGTFSQNSAFLCYNRSSSADEEKAQCLRGLLWSNGSTGQTHRTERPNRAPFGEIDSWADCGKLKESSIFTDF